MGQFETAELTLLALAGHPPASDHRPLTVVELSDRLEMGAETMADRIALLSALSDLEADGLVRAESVDNETSYRLTEAGFERASETFSAIADDHLTIVTHGNGNSSGERRTHEQASNDAKDVHDANDVDEPGSTRTVRLRETDELLPDPAIVRALARRTDDGVLYLDEFVGEDFIDREAALETLRTHYRETAAGTGRTVLLTGEAGIGKTTLAQEATRRFSDARICESVAQAASDRPYQVVRDAIDDHLDTSPFDRPELALDSPDDFDDLRASLFADVADALLDLAADRPVVLLLDEGHHAGVESIELVADLTRRITDGPVLIILVTRLDEFDADEAMTDLRALVERGDGHDHLSLTPFSRTDTRVQIESMLGTRRLPEAFVNLVFERTGGTPLFVAETLAQMQEMNALAPEYDVFPTAVEETPLPDSVEEMIGTRLDSLDATGETILELAALLEGEFSLERLRSVADYDRTDTEMTGEVVAEYVNLLVDVGVLGRTDGDGIRFLSGLVRETVVTRMPEQRRQEYHRRIAHALAAQAGDDPGESATIAAHFERGGNEKRALDAWLEAATEAESVYAHESALEAYEHALALARGLNAQEMIVDILASVGEVASLLGRQERAERAFEYVRANADRPDRRHRAIVKLAAVYEATADYDEARSIIQEGLEEIPRASIVECQLRGVQAHVEYEQADFEAAASAAKRQRELAATLDEPGFEAEAAHLLGLIGKQQGDFDGAVEHLDEALELARTLGDRERQANIRKDFGTVCHRREDPEQARHHFQEALELGRELGIRHVEADSLGNLGLVAYFEGKYDQARAYLEENRRIKSDIGDRNGVATTDMNLGVMADEQGHYDQAREYHERSLAVNREIGDRHGEALCLKNIGIVLQKQADYEEAIDYLERSKAVDEDIGNRWGVAGTLDILGGIYRMRGDYDRAATFHEGARDVGEEIEDDRLLAESTAYLGWVSLDRRDLETAREQFETSQELAEELGRSGNELVAIRGLGRIARLNGDYETAGEYLEQLLTLYTERDNVFEAARTRLEQARLALDADNLESAREHLDRAQATFESLDSPHMYARCLEVQGRIAIEFGQSERARELLERAVETFEEVGAIGDALAAIRLVVDGLEATDDSDRAEEWRTRKRSLLADAPPAIVDQHPD